jgi:hypothetical protein
MVGGIVTSFLLELLVYPAIYAIWRERSLHHQDELEPSRGNLLQNDPYATV